MVKILKLIIALSFINSCSKQTVVENQSIVGNLSFWIENDFLYYDTSFDDQNIKVQKVNFKIINHTNKPYVLPFDSSFFSTYKDEGIFLKGSQYMINQNQIYTPFIQIIAEDGEIASVDPIISDIESDCESLIEILPQLITIEPYGHKNFSIDFSMPFYKVNCFYTTHTQSSFYDGINLLTPNGVGDLYAEISYTSNNWEETFDKRTIYEMKKRGLILFEGNIFSNKVPIAPSHEQNE